MDWIRCQRVAERMQKNAPWFELYAREQADGKRCVIDIENLVIGDTHLWEGARGAVEIGEKFMEGEAPFLAESERRALSRIEGCGARVTNIHEGIGIREDESEVGIKHIHFKAENRGTASCLVEKLLEEP